MKFNGKKLAEIRKAKNMTQEELAKKLSRSQANIQAWENERYLPKRININLIAEALGCYVSDLIDDYMPLPPKSKYAEMADDPLLPALLDSWLAQSLATKANTIELLQILATLDRAKQAKLLELAEQLQQDKKGKSNIA